MRIAIVYDCLYPNTVGGAERWYRALAERLQHDHEITYLTRRQWGDEGPDTPFATVAVSPGGPLYTDSGRRRIWPPIQFGLGILWHLLRHGNRYDVVHSASFPYFSLIGAWLAMRLRRNGRLVVDWFEVWSRDYWIDYLGPVGGRVGSAVQRLCIVLPDRSFVFSRLHERRLLHERHRAPVERLTGIYEEEGNPAQVGGDQRVAARPPVVVFAGRHIPEKRVTIVPDAVDRARNALPALRCVVYGDGPDLEKVRARVTELGLDDVIQLPGRVPGEQVRASMAGAACLLLPSRREGYGLVVVEANACGTPAVVVAGTENAAVELIEPGVNGYVSPSADPEAIAQALVTAIGGGERLRSATLEWYRTHEDELSIENSLAAVVRSYGARG